METILRVENLKKDYVISKKGILLPKYNYLHAVNDVSFSIKQGETLGVVGESGCGKSTLARLIMNLIKPTAGQIFYRGVDLSTLNKEELKATRKNMQMIFQNPLSSLDPKKRIIELLCEPLEIYNLYTKEEREQRALDMMSNVGMHRSHAYRFPHEFSGGQAQRINIARALMLNPEVIICDEPVSALDVSIQAQVINLLLDLQDQFKLTYMFISHDLNIIRYFCDRMIVMTAGKVVESGDSEEVYNNPQHEYTKKLLGAKPKGTAI